MPVETEVKFRVLDRAALEARLARLGAEPGPVEDEVNLLLDDAALSLRSKGEALRVREVRRPDGSRTATVTFKGPATFERGVKSRRELESEVKTPEVLRELFAALGFTPVFRYDKRRAPWRFAEAGRPLVVVDETPLGVFAELEGDEPAVRALAAELGVAESELLPQSYASLYQTARGHDPSLPPDMLFPESAP